MNDILAQIKRLGVLPVVAIEEAADASHHAWSACLYDGQNLLVSRRYDITHIGP